MACGRFPLRASPPATTIDPSAKVGRLDVTPGDEVSIETVDTLKPALLRSLETTDFLYLLMPVRVS